MSARRLTLAAAVLGAALPSLAMAQQGGQLLGQFTDWSAYTATTDKGKVCFAISQPKKRLPDGLKRDPAYFFVTDRPADKVRNEISLQIGFPAKAGSTAALAIGTANFDLVTEGERAWSNGRDDARIIDGMRKAADMSIKTTSGRGNVTTDTYSLKGLSQAIDRIGQECH
jgi:hypothetical protein